MSPTEVGLIRFPRLRDFGRAYTSGSGGSPIAAPLSLSALSIDLVVALAQRPAGVGAGELARIVDGAPTSVQNALRLLAAHGFVTRGSSRFALARDHPAAAELVALGLRLPPPDAAIRLVLRASDIVDFAAVDNAGFVIGTRPGTGTALLDALDDALATIRRDRAESMSVLRFESGELGRILNAAVGLRRRVLEAQIIKGVVRPVGPSASGTARSTGSGHQNS